MELIVRSIKAFSLVELLVSVVILSIILLALSYSMALYVRQNILTDVRNEAILLANSCIYRLQYGQSCTAIVSKTIRDLSFKFYVNSPDPSTFSSGNNNVTVVVFYHYPPASQGFCSLAPGVSCYTDADCSSGQICVNHQYSLSTIIFRP